MKHAITLGDLLLFLGVIGGLGTAGFGLLMTFAAGMASAPDEDAGRKGRITAVAGAILMVGCIVGLTR